MKGTDFRRLKIDDQLNHLVEQVCLKLDELGFLGITKLLQYGGFNFHIVVDKLYLQHQRDSEYMLRIRNAKAICLDHIQLGEGDQNVRNSLDRLRLKSFVKKAGGYKDLTWTKLYKRICAIKTDKYKQRSDCHLIVNGLKLPATGQKRNAVIALLSKFLTELDGEEFDYLLEVSNFYDAYIVLNEGLNRLPNCKLSKTEDK